jgi:hypothetical protein
MAENQSPIAAAIQSVLDKAKATAASGKLSSSMFGQLLDQLKAAAIKGASSLAVAGYEKKALVMEQVGKFIDSYLPLPAYLFFARPWIKQWLMSLASGAIDALYKELIPQPTPTPTPSTP